MASGATVDIKNRYCTFGPHRIGGYAPGTSIRATPRVQANVLVDGVDDESFWVKNDSKSYDMQVVLQQTSNSNDVLDALFHADDLAPGGLTLPWTLTEAPPTGRTLLASPGAKIVQLPEVTYGDGGETRVWNFNTHFMATKVGGVGVTPNNPSP